MVKKYKFPYHNKNPRGPLAYANLYRLTLIALSSLSLFAILNLKAPDVPMSLNPVVD